MKKIISIILILIIIAIPTTAFAEGYEGSGETEIVSHQYSTYTITIPERIVLEEAPNIPITLSNANIETGYKVEVIATNLFSGTLTLYNTEDSTYTKTIGFYDGITSEKLVDSPLATFSEEQFDIEQEYEKTVCFSPEGETFNLKAGIYTGILTYSFQCIPNE